jgi:predicted hydrolase (HD superfamily)
VRCKNRRGLRIYLKEILLAIHSKETLVTRYSEKIMAALVSKEKITAALLSKEKVMGALVSKENVMAALVLE